ncbi:hypothetical protein [Pelagibius marinus]|uniref:hypothetical protein n=1 Tax=Pelagibius marinus TaxID=2762760 RepID=UPI0018724B27|nr:hypothetical protein [Pelagibius marinus]
MKLGVMKAVRRCFGFGLRHLPVFYLLCLLVGAPRLLFSQTAGQGWQVAMLVSFFEIVIACMVVSIMVWTMIRDRRGEAWTVLPAIGDSFQRAPMILGVAIVVATVSLAFGGLGMYLATLHPVAAAVPSVVMFILKLIFCVAIPCAAVSEGGVFEALWQSARLSAGSRLRILGVYILMMLPFGIVAVIAAALLPADVMTDLQSGNLPMLWILLAGALGSAFLYPVPVAIHEQLAELGDDLEFERTAGVFDLGRRFRAATPPAPGAGTARSAESRATCGCNFLSFFRQASGPNAAAKGSACQGSSFRPNYAARKEPLL